MAGLRRDTWLDTGGGGGDWGTGALGCIIRKLLIFSLLGPNPALYRYFAYYTGIILVFGVYFATFLGAEK